MLKAVRRTGELRRIPTKSLDIHQVQRLRGPCPKAERDALGAKIQEWV